MLFAVFFAFWRVMEIITLIPTMGMLAWFVDGFVKSNQLTPDYILILFIVSVLALAWAIFTLFSYHRSSTNAQFVAFIDLAFVGAFIAAVYFLRFMAHADCTNISRGDPWAVGGSWFSVSGAGVDVQTNKPCAMLKASFAFGIMNCIFFFFTAVLAFMHGGRLSSADRDRRTVSRHSHHTEHYHRHGHRRRSGSRSHRSSHSHSRVYV